MVASLPEEYREPPFHDHRTVRLRPHAPRRTACAGGALDRACQIQFRRRQQRSGPGSGRGADRGRQRGVKARGPDGRASGPQGDRPLRDFLVTKLKRDAGITCAADDIMIVSGSLQALDLVNQTLLARGDTVLIEQESYQGAINRLTRLGVKAVGIPLDDDGMRMDALAAVLADHKARGITPKYIYTITTVQNQTGAIMSEQRAQ